MRPHPRIRKTVKWGGAVVTALLLMVWIGSAWRVVGYVASNGVASGVIGGQFMVRWWAGREPTVGWVMEPATEGFRWWVPPQIAAADWTYFVPLWSPAGVVLVLTIMAWRADRRRDPAACANCSYPRIGLAPSALCPECGSPAPVAAAAPIKGS